MVDLVTRAAPLRSSEGVDSALSQERLGGRPPGLTRTPPWPCAREGGRGGGGETGDLPMVSPGEAYGPGRRLMTEA